MKMILMGFLSSLLMVSCSADSSSPEKSRAADPRVAVESDSIASNSVEALSEVDSFAKLIEYPEDIVLYKSRKSMSNSGGSGTPDFYYRPKSAGFYLSFFLFYPKPVHLESEGEWFDGLKVTTYRFGSKIGHYHDTSEIFISLKAKVQEPELRSFNLVGQSKYDVKKMLGDTYITKDNFILYSSTNKVLVVHFVDEKVSWFKYAILQKNFSEFEEIPTALITY